VYDTGQNSDKGGIRRAAANLVTPAPYSIQKHSIARSGSMTLEPSPLHPGPQLRNSRTASWCSHENVLPRVRWHGSLHASAEAPRGPRNRARGDAFQESRFCRRESCSFFFDDKTFRLTMVPRIRGGLWLSGKHPS
jgi:hypothetical protein